MLEAGTLTWMTEQAGWLLPLLLATAALCIGRIHKAAPIAALIGFVASLGGAGALLATRFAASPPEAVKLFVWSCALLSLVSAGGATLASRRARWKHPNATQRSSLLGSAHTAALVFGAAAFTVLLVILGIRLVYVAVNFITVFAVEGAWDYCYDPSGLWSLGCLFAACTVAALSTRDRQLYTCQCLIAVVIVTWACLLWPVFRMTSPGGLRKTGATLALTAGFAILLTSAATLIWWTQRRRCAGSTLPNGDSSASEPPLWPGFRVSFSAVALVVLLLTLYQFAVPVGIVGAGFRICATVSLGSAALVACAGFYILSQSWSPNLADITVGLMSLTHCCLVLCVLPSYPQPLAERYPVVFTAMIVGLALAMGSCTWLATSSWWSSRKGALQTTREGLVLHARRGACVNAILALAIGGLMAVWPRLESIAVSDASMGRVTAGFGANLLLLLVVLWSARRLQWPAFHILTLLTMASAAGFMLMRMLPYTPQFG